MGTDHHADGALTEDRVCRPVRWFGRFIDGTKSTPLVILERAIRDPRMRQMLATSFNDAKPARAESLEAAIAALPGIEKLKYAPQIDKNKVGSGTVNAFARPSITADNSFCLLHLKQFLGYETRIGHRPRVSRARPKRQAGAVGRKERCEEGALELGNVAPS